MTKSILLAAAGALVAATTVFAPVANAGHGHGHYYKTHYYKPVYTYTYKYVPVCKWVYHYGHYKKVCW